MADLFKIAEIGASLPDQAFARMRAKLRLDLVALQQKARAQGRPALIILNGVRGAGVIDTVNLLNTWMDPRWISTIAFDTPSDEERERPLFWRYWRSLPAAGSIGLYLGGWYADPIAERCAGTMSATGFKRRLQDINAFEASLAAEGAMILKFWLHVSKSQQKKVLPHVDSDPLIGFRASDNTWTTPTDYAAFTNAAADAIRATSDEQRPWFLVEGTDDNYRRASVLSALSSRLEAHCSSRPSGRAPKKVKAARNYLKAVRIPPVMSDAAYAKAFHHEQQRLHDLQREARAKGISTVVVFEGWDAAGKGGAIRRLTFALNARDYKVVPISAPNDEERRYHYLWRFWRQLGRAGDMTVFDRSWYGRVLVERVEKLIDKPTYVRGYSEINRFERQLHEHGHVIVKFWLHITKDEQKRRFKERRESPYKSWKLTKDDYRNRKKWKAYERAVNDMLENTSPAIAPWTVMSAIDKKRARITVLQTVSDALEQALRQRAAKAQK